MYVYKSINKTEKSAYWGYRNIDSSWNSAYWSIFKKFFMAILFAFRVFVRNQDERMSLKKYFHFDVWHGVWVNELATRPWQLLHQNIFNSNVINCYKVMSQTFSCGSNGNFHIFAGIPTSLYALWFLVLSMTAFNSFMWEGFHDIYKAISYCTRIISFNVLGLTYVKVYKIPVNYKNSAHISFEINRIVL